MISKGVLIVMDTAHQESKLADTGEKIAFSKQHMSFHGKVSNIERARFIRSLQEMGYLIKIAPSGKSALAIRIPVPEPLHKW